MEQLDAGRKGDGVGIRHAEALGRVQGEPGPLLPAGRLEMIVKGAFQVCVRIPLRGRMARFEKESANRRQALLGGGARIVFP